MAEKFGRSQPWVAAALLGLVFMASGVFMVASALDAENDVRAGLAAEKIETTDPIALLANPDLYPDARMPKDENKDGLRDDNGAPMPPALDKVLVDTPAEAQAMADVIKVHTLKTTEGKTYAQLDREDPNRDFYLKSVTLRSALTQAYMGFRVAELVMGIGAITMALGALTFVVLTPVAYMTGRHS